MRGPTGGGDRARAGVVGALVAAAVALAACTSSGGPTQEGGAPTTAATATTTSETAAEAVLAAAPADSFLRMLALVPAVEDAAYGTPISMLHVTRAIDQLGLERPAVGAAEQELDDLYAALFGIFLRPWEDGTSDEMEAELGVRREQIDQFLTAPSTRGVAPVYAIALGTFDPAAVDVAVRAEPVWGAQLETDEHASGPFYVWGDEDGPLGSRTPVRPYGFGGRLAVREDFLVWSPYRVDVVHVLDAAGDPSRSLLSLPWVPAIAAEADRAGLTQLSLSWVADPARFRSTNAQRTDTSLPELDMPQGYAVGVGRFPDGDVGQTLLAYASEEQAAANLDAARASFEGLRPVGLFPRSEVTIEQRGTLIVLTSRGPRDGTEQLDVTQLHLR